MPTGYTAAVCDGKQTEFKDFALTCARAFGALISMRDAPSDAPIPDVFKPSRLHAESLIRARARLAELQDMTAEEAHVAAECDYASKLESEGTYDAEIDAQDRRCSAMLKKVEAWIPPTAQHVELKAFMLDQLRISMRGDYHATRPTKQTWQEWLKAEQEEIERNIVYHAAEHAKEITRTNERNAWVKALRDSL